MPDIALKRAWTPAVRLKTWTFCRRTKESGIPKGATIGALWPGPGNTHPESYPPARGVEQPRWKEHIEVANISDGSSSSILGTHVLEALASMDMENNDVGGLGGI